MRIGRRTIEFAALLLIVVLVFGLKQLAFTNYRHSNGPSNSSGKVVTHSSENMASISFSESNYPSPASRSSTSARNTTLISEGDSSKLKFHSADSNRRPYIPLLDNRTIYANKLGAVNHPFPVSPSVVDWCGGDLKSKDANMCKEVFLALKNMGYEKRDPKWAPVVEAKLWETIATFKGDYTIRALECRETFCAYEIAAASGSAADLVDKTNLLDKLLFGPIVAYGYDVDVATGTKDFVTLVVYSRR